MSNSQDKWTDLGPLDSFKPGKPIPGRIGSEEILAINLKGEYFVFERKCPHQSRYLDESEFRQKQIHCRYHLVSFSLEDGSIINNGGYIGLPDLRIFPVKVEKGHLWTAPTD